MKEKKAKAKKHAVGPSHPKPEAPVKTEEKVENKGKGKKRGA
jgi:hypothetical protein